MPKETANARIANTNLDQATKRELLALLGAVLDGQSAINAKLDAEASLTAKNFAATFDAIVSKS